MTRTTVPGAWSCCQAATTRRIASASSARVASAAIALEVTMARRVVQSSSI